MARWSAIERNLREEFGPLLAGVDEVGRGPLAGPVVACAVVMPPGIRAISGVDDSKKLTPSTRAELALQIRKEALAISLGAASVHEIDRLNILNATVLAMQRALKRIPDRLKVTPDHVLVDGIPLKKLGIPHTAIVKGDAKCYSIACASIVAKVTRDKLMEALSARYKPYGWERNSGYGTPVHRSAVAAHGLTAHHRRSFCLNIQTTLDLDQPPVSSSED